MRRINLPFGILRTSRSALLTGLSLLALVSGVLVLTSGGQQDKGTEGTRVLSLAQAGRSIVAVAQPGIANAAPQHGAAGGAVERGKYLVTLAGCNDCHTPLKMGPKGPEPDMSRMLSGHPADLKMPPPPSLQGPWMWAGAATMTAFYGPWGLSYAPNLTSDEETGIGAWDAELFIAAMRNGKIMGAGRPIQPPMPWQGIAQMTDDDLKAIFAYLQTVPPVKNQVPEYEPPAPQSAPGGH
jgi:hypothetical protein